MREGGREKESRGREGEKRRRVEGLREGGREKEESRGSEGGRETKGE